MKNKFFLIPLFLIASCDSKNVGNYIAGPMEKLPYEYNGVFLIPEKIGDEIKYGLQDESGNYLVYPTWNDTTGFNQNGIAAVEIGYGKAAKWGFINISGEFVLQPQFDYVVMPENLFPISINSGMFAVNIDDKWGYVDDSGKLIIYPKFDRWTQFSENGMSPVRVGDEKTGKWGYIDKSGKFIIRPQFDDAGLFSENGLAPVRVGDEKTSKFGYIDKSGELIIQPQFQFAGHFAENGMAPVRVGDEKTSKWGYIDNSGKFIIRPQFSYAWEFSKNGQASVQIEEKWGLITDGRAVPKIDKLKNWISSLNAPKCDKEYILTIVRAFGTHSKSKQFDQIIQKNRPWTFEINNSGFSEITEIEYNRPSKIRTCQAKTNLSTNLENSKYLSFSQESEMIIDYKILPNPSQKGKWIVTSTFQENITYNNKENRNQILFTDRDNFCKAHAYGDYLDHMDSEIWSNPFLRTDYRWANNYFTHSDVVNGDLLIDSTQYAYPYDPYVKSYFLDSEVKDWLPRGNEFSVFLDSIKHLDDSQLISIRNQIENAIKKNPDLAEKRRWIVNTEKLGVSKKITVHYSILKAVMAMRCYDDPKYNYVYFDKEKYGPVIDATTVVDATTN